MLGAWQIEAIFQVGAIVGETTTELCGQQLNARPGSVLGCHWIAAPRRVRLVGPQGREEGGTCHKLDWAAERALCLKAFFRDAILGRVERVSCPNIFWPGPGSAQFQLREFMICEAGGVQRC